MKYLVDMDALIECLDCVYSTLINGERYIPLNTLTDFLARFPKDTLSVECVEYNTQPPKPKQAESAHPLLDMKYNS